MSLGLRSFRIKAIELQAMCHPQYPFKSNMTPAKAIVRFSHGLVLCKILSRFYHSLLVRTQEYAHSVYWDLSHMVTGFHGMKEPISKDIHISF